MRRAVIIGGSLGGLFAGLLLRQAGWAVTVCERSPGDLASRGAGVGTHPEQFAVMRRLGLVADESIGVRFATRRCLGPDGVVVAELPFDKIQTSWTLLYRMLRGLLPDDCYRPAMRLVAVEPHPDTVDAIFADGTRATGEMLVGADGAQSTVRAEVFPGTNPRYAGYVAWRGVVPEAAVPAIARDDLVGPFGFFLTPRETMLSYLQPAPDGDHRPGRRGLNWVWYHPVPAALLPALCTDATGRHHGLSIPPPLIRGEVIAGFRVAARAILPPQYVALTEATPAPFFQPICDLDSPRIVEGRVALLGDAAFVARPHVAAGVAKAALNAAWLVDALAEAGGDVPAGLAGYQARAQPFGAAMVAHARFLGAYLEDPPRAGLQPEPLPVMQATGAPLRAIQGLAALLDAAPQRR